MFITASQVGISLNESSGGVATLSFGGDVTINSGASLQNINAGNQNILNFNGTNLTVNGSLVNSNANNFAGGTVVITNQMRINSTNLVLSANSMLENQNSGQIASDTGEGPLLFFSNALALNGAQIVNSNSGSISNDSTGTTLLAPSIDINGGGSLSNLNSGLVASDGSIGSLVSATTINIDANGSFQNDDQAKFTILNVNAGGILKGTGNFFANGRTTATVTNNGNVEPVDVNGTPGTMSINGTYIQGSGGTFTERLASASSASQISVTTTGTTQLDGTLDVVLASGNTVTVGDTFIIIQMGESNTLSGQFASIITNSTSLVPHVQYILGPNGEVILTFTSSVVPPGPSPVIGLASSYAGGFLQTVLSDINHINSQITLRMENLRRHFGASSARNNGRLATRAERDPKNLVASAGDNFIARSPQTQEKQEQLRREVTQEEKAYPLNLYFGPTGRAAGDLHTRKDQPGLNYWSAGALAGLDYAFSQVGLGFMDSLRKSRSARQAALGQDHYR